MSKCINCNSELPDHAKFCPDCGARQPDENESQPNVENTDNAVSDMPEQDHQETQSQNSYTYGQHTENMDGYWNDRKDESYQNSQTAQNGGEYWQNNQTARNGGEYWQNNQNSQNGGEYWRNNQTAQNGGEYWQNNQNSHDGGEYWRNNQTAQNGGEYWQNNQNPYRPYQPVNWVPYLVAAIFSTVCCCIPFGIVAIVYAVKINSDIAAGRYDAAEEAARNAKMWCIISIAVGIVVNLVSCSLAISLW